MVSQLNRLPFMPPATLASVVRLSSHCSPSFLPVDLANLGEFGRTIVHFACLPTVREFNGGKVAVTWVSGGPNGGARAAVSEAEIIDLTND